MASKAKEAPKTKQMDIEKGKEWVPENVRKKRDRDAKLQAARTQERAKRKEENKKRIGDWRARAERYNKEYLDEQRNLVDAKRKARAEGAYYVPAEPKVALVTRISGINHKNPQVRQILRILRLRQVHNATFVKLNKASLNLLVRVNPFVTYGYPTRKTVSDLIYKRGYGKVNGQRIPLTNNEIIAQVLGKYNITCVEDLIHEIYTLGPNFKQANNFLWPFKLNPPRGGFRVKRHSYVNGGDWGNRENQMNELVERML
jgi:large subunit ribosomal protein L7e